MAEIRQEETVLIVEVLSEQAKGRCPLCEEESNSVHSRYVRRLKDVPVNSLLDPSDDEYKLFVWLLF